MVFHINRISQRFRTFSRPMAACSSPLPAGGIFTATFFSVVFAKRKREVNAILKAIDTAEDKETARQK